MTAKTLEKVPVSLGGFVHPSETVYGEEMSSVAGFPPTDLGGHYDHMSGATGETGQFIRIRIRIRITFISLHLIVQVHKSPIFQFDSSTVT